DDGVRAMVIGTDDFGRQPQLPGGNRNQSEIRANQSIVGQSDFRAGSEEARVGEIRDTGADNLMQPFANEFVPRAWPRASQTLAFESLVIGHTHAWATTVRRYPPVCGRKLRGFCPGVPRPTMPPPASPPSGPRSMTQSAW